MKNTLSLVRGFRNWLRVMQRILLFVLIGLLPLNAAADGKVFSRQAVIAHPTIPDQRALIYWSNGMERLVIETRFSGEGTNFAWVVPLPSQPVVEAASAGVLNTIAYQLRPRLIHKPTPWCSLFGVLLALGWMAISAYHQRRFGCQTFFACSLAGISLLPVSLFGAVLAWLFMLWAAERVSKGRQSVLEVFVIFALLFVLSSMLLPTLGTAGSKGSAASDVTVLTSARVGAFETTTISAKTAEGLLDWLRENEFALSTNAQPVIADYVKRGWVFVASKIAREQSGLATNAIHPLSFTFPAAQPIYPMRLTGVDAAPLQVELYVFGPQQAQADGFKAETCVATSFPETAPWQLSPGEPIPIMHPTLRTWTAGFPVVTKLSARLQPSQMQEDVVLRWTDFVSHRHAVYSWEAAMTVAGNWVTGLMLGCFVLYFAGMIYFQKWRRQLSRVSIGITLLAGAVFGLMFTVFPKVEVQAGRFHKMTAQNDLKLLAYVTQSEWTDTAPQTLLDARRAVTFENGMRTNNILLGGLIREEDSPGNYVIRQSTNGFEFLWFDGNGAEQTIAPR